MLESSNGFVALDTCLQVFGFALYIGYCYWVRKYSSLRSTFSLVSQTTHDSGAVLGNIAVYAQLSV